MRDTVAFGAAHPDAASRERLDPGAHHSVAACSRADSCGRDSPSTPARRDLPSPPTSASRNVGGRPIFNSRGGRARAGPPRGGAPRRPSTAKAPVHALVRDPRSHVPTPRRAGLVSCSTKKLEFPRFSRFFVRLRPRVSMGEHLKGPVSILRKSPPWNTLLQPSAPTALKAVRMTIGRGRGPARDEVPDTSEPPRIVASGCGASVCGEQRRRPGGRDRPARTA